MSLFSFFFLANIQTSWQNNNHTYFYLQTRTDGNDTCLPREYPKINDCLATEDSVIYKDRIDKETKSKKEKKDKNGKNDKDDKKDKDDREDEKKDKDDDKKNKKDKDDDKDDKKNKAPDIPCNFSVLIFAVPKFNISGFYDPCEIIICSSNSLKLALSLLMVAFINMVFTTYWMMEMKSAELQKTATFSIKQM